MRLFLAACKPRRFKLFYIIFILNILPVLLKSVYENILYILLFPCTGSFCFF